MPIHFEWTHGIFKQKYSKSSKFDTFLKQRFICRLVGMPVLIHTCCHFWPIYAQGVCEPRRKSRKAETSRTNVSFLSYNPNIPAICNFPAVIVESVYYLHSLGQCYSHLTLFVTRMDYDRSRTSARARTRTSIR